MDTPQSAALNVRPGRSDTNQLGLHPVPACANEWLFGSVFNFIEIDSSLISVPHRTDAAGYRFFVGTGDRVTSACTFGSINYRHVQDHTECQGAPEHGHRAAIEVRWPILIGH